MAAWKAMLSGSSCVRRRSSTGVRSAPPPNQLFVVTTMRVFMCTAGTCGFCGCAITEMPEAQKRGSSSAPGICARNSGANSPCTVETWTPTFSKTRPCMHRHHAAAAGRAAMVGALPGRAHEAARRPGRQAARPAGSASSTASSAAQISSRNVSNQLAARAFASTAMLFKKRPSREEGCLLGYRASLQSGEAPRTCRSRRPWRR